MNSTSSPRVGFIGLGSQGGPMARRIIEAGYPVTLWARRPATLEPFADTHAKIAGSPAELAAASDLVCVCVRDDADTEEVVDAVLGGLAASGVIAVHSTVHPDTCRRLAERARVAGVRLIDAPVSGGTLARIGEHAGHLLRKDVQLIVDVAGHGDGERGATLLAAADAALTLMNVARA